MRSPVTDLVQRYNALTEEQQKVFLDLVDPQPEPEQVEVKRTRKKKAEAAASQKRGLPSGNTNSDVLCIAQVPNLDVPCGEREDALIHDPKGGYASSHPFVPPAQTAGKRSRQKSVAASSEASTEAEKVSATAVGATGD